MSDADTLTPVLDAPELVAAERASVDIGDYQFGFHDPTDKYAFTSRRGLDREIVAQISEMKNEPGWMRDFRLKSFEIFESKPMPNWGGRHVGHRLPEHLLLRPGVAISRRSPGTTFPKTSARPTTGSASPRRRRSTSSGVKAQYESEVVYGSLQEDLAEAGGALHRHRLGAARSSGAVPRILRHDHPAERQQVRRPQLGRLVGRLVHLRPARA